MPEEKIELISLSQISVEKHNVRKRDINVGIEDLAASIKAFGLLQPITAYLDSKTQKYVILAGQRRLNAHHYLNEQNPNSGFDVIKCIIIDEPQTNEDKLALSLAENVTQLQMSSPDLIKAVTDLYNVYNDYDLVCEKYGLTKYMVDKYVRLARLPTRLKDAINDGEISSNYKQAENASIRAVDALEWIKGGDTPVDTVLELAKEYAKGDIDPQKLDTAAKRGGDIETMRNTARKHETSKQQIDLSTEVAEKLKRVADANGETTTNRATSYVVKGVAKDYNELEG